MIAHRKQQLMYIFADLLSAEAVWLLFALFRKLVNDGVVFGVDTILIPIFNFYPPLIIYPLVCVAIHYLSGYYLRPFRKSAVREFVVTFWSAVFISLLFFFLIIIDDEVTNYERYLISLAVLFVLQFTISYLPRCLITYLTRRNGTYRTRTIHTIAEANRVRKGTVEEVIIDLPKNSSENTLYSIINRLYPLGVEISVIPRVYDMLTGAARIVEIGGQPLVRITEHKMSDAELCIKRATDVVVSLCVLVLLSPLYIFLYVLVYATSKGKAIYRQERIGLHGIPFHILKFRTMCEDAEQEKPMLTHDHDPRITRVGAFLRKYRLDELPQMWNVLRGDMSLVGPRPERAYFIRQIEQKAPYYCLLYKIRPGLTSWGPVKVGYTDTIDKMVDRLNYDITYMENMSLRLDLKILFFTIGVIIDGKGK
ncbi:MAG: exopolysaccharide biosynthesis polyprenyl glycosylphosphotransferase [Paludibacteraceae bacterium]